MSIKKGSLNYTHNGTKINLTFDVGKLYKDDYIAITFATIKNRLMLNIKPKEEIIINNIELIDEIEYKETDRIFLNGFQSWTDSREFKINEKIPKINKLAYNKLNAYGDYSFYNYTGKNGILHSWSYTYIKRNANEVVFYGSLSENTGYTLFEHNTEKKTLNIKKECEGLKIQSDYKVFDIIFLTGKENDVFAEYFKSINPNNKLKAHICSGWTSWYYHYTNINNKIIMDNLEAFSKRQIPIDIFQIDDGYQNAVGDWLKTNSKFLKGMKYVADKINEKGYKAGLWIAPFICEKKSILYQTHYDWILKDNKGNPVIAGYGALWSGNFYALDFYNENVRDYLKTVFDTVLNEWGFDMVKLDFLYAAALIPRKDKTRGQIMTEAMQFIRNTIGNDKLILGCGVPLIPSYGLVDYCRIGADIGLQWEKEWLPNLTKVREIVSTENTLLNTIGRRHFNGNAFFNDPDVFILRKQNNKLTTEQKFTIFLINLIFGGLVFTSDNIEEYSEDEMHTYLSLFPMKDKKIKQVDIINNNLYKIMFEIEDRNYIAFANLGNKEIKAGLDVGKYFSNKTCEIVDEKNDIVLPPYTSICVLKIDEKKSIELLGGKGHIFSGSEIDTFKIKWLGSISLEYNPKSINRDTIYIKIPTDKEGYKVNGEFIKAEKINGINIIKVNLP